MLTLLVTLCAITADPAPTITIAVNRFRVVDGDTISFVMDGKPEKLRIVGIDTPESVDPRKPVQAFSHEAAEYLKTITAGSPLTLEFPGAGTAKRDRYGRLLAYLRRDDGEDVGYLMVKDGYAHHYAKYPHPRSKEYAAAERRARESKRGLWADPRPPQPLGASTP